MSFLKNLGSLIMGALSTHGKDSDHGKKLVELANTTQVINTSAPHFELWMCANPTQISEMLGLPSTCQLVHVATMGVPDPSVETSLVSTFGKVALTMENTRKGESYVKVKVLAGHEGCFQQLLAADTLLPGEKEYPETDSAFEYNIFPDRFPDSEVQSLLDFAVDQARERQTATTAGGSEFTYSTCNPKLHVFALFQGRQVDTESTNLVATVTAGMIFAWVDPSVFVETLSAKASGKGRSTPAPRRNNRLSSKTSTDALDELIGGHNPGDESPFAH